MQTNYYFLRQLSNKLSTELTGLVLAECFTQEKDEILLGFCSEGKQWRDQKDFYIKAVLHPDFACLAFPKDFKRAGRNSANLFKEIINLKVLSVRQFENERAFALYFENNFVLLFKMYGNRSNIILFQENEVIDLFQNKLVIDNNVAIDKLDRPIDQSFEAFQEKGWKTLFPTFGKEITKFLSKNGQEAITWEQIQAITTQLENPTYYLKTIDYQPVLSLIAEDGEIVNTFTDPLEASNAFYYAHNKINVIDKEKGVIIKILQKRKTRTQAYIDKCYQQLNSLDTGVKHDEIANIIMANLHAIPERTEVIELYDFYRDQPIKVRLKPDLSPQKSAENYYRKSKNEKIEIEKLMENLEAKEMDMSEIEQQIKDIEGFETLKEFRKYLKAHQLEPSQKVVDTVQTLFKYYQFEGYEILVGRNAKNNDLLTQRFARKEDLWLHARDVAGSHVVVRKQAGRNFPVNVIEKAAGLAAFYSKRKTDTLCPVIVTPKKYVRKTRDLGEGQVIIDKEEVIMIEPSL
ncbi:NFACT RNA binding domain-containing protein [Arcicella aquatica]|uniref:NFACT RNA binding domain-containing protein n=1 Tax=Arcicella aquatica TaxID=217141 RepID=A0ABU5QSK2_9BACT|nr:NFACT RNA binding domain-containing protein [Arcicella aquatica]MEA5260085.1 NFACT RNA binding domain-containing protein [Arcicella aquatica]